MHCIPCWREPAGRPRPVAASYLHAGNRFGEFGSFVKIDAPQGVKAGEWFDVDDFIQTIHDGRDVERKEFQG